MYTIGMRVLAQWGGSWYPGTVTQMSGDQYFVQYDDGSTAWVSMNMLQPEGGFAVGSRIRRLWTDGNYYHGTVQQSSGSEIFVQFDDGDTAWLGAHEVEPEMMGGPGMMGKGAPGMMGKGAPGMMGGGFAVGQRVTAQWTDGGWYGATITQVGGPDNFFVTFDDGYTSWLQSYQLQPQGGMGSGMAPGMKGGMAPGMKGGMMQGGGYGGYSVGMRIQKQWVDGNWYGGTIMQLGDDGSYFVQFDDGDTAWVAAHEIQPG